MHQEADNFIESLWRMNQRGRTFVNPSIVNKDGVDYLHVEVARFDDETGEVISNRIFEFNKSEYITSYIRHKQFQTFTANVYQAITGTPIE